MDDVTLVGRIDVVANDIQHIDCFGTTLDSNKISTNVSQFAHLLSLPI
jgi:hypothetical protein